MHRNDIFNSMAFKKHLMHMLIVVYVDSEKVDWYSKFKYRHSSAAFMEYAWQNKEVHTQFKQLPELYPEDFNEFCNLLINDMNKLLFDGLLALEECKNFEDLKEDQETWN